MEARFLFRLPKTYCCMQQFVQLFSLIDADPHSHIMKNALLVLGLRVNHFSTLIHLPIPVNTWLMDVALGWPEQRKTVIRTRHTNALQSKGSQERETTFDCHKQKWIFNTQKKASAKNDDKQYPPFSTCISFTLQNKNTYLAIFWLLSIITYRCWKITVQSQHLSTILMILHHMECHL